MNHGNRQVKLTIEGHGVKQVWPSHKSRDEGFLSDLFATDQIEHGQKLIRSDVLGVKALALG